MKSQFRSVIGHSASRWILMSAVFVMAAICKTNAIQLGGITDMLQNFEALDPEVVNLFAYKNKPAHRKADLGEMDITDIDTSDIMNCFTTLSYMCFQRKIIVYLDALNRVSKINIFGGYMSFVKMTTGVSPPITEQMLASRHNANHNTLGGLLTHIFDDFIDSHILRITVPVLNTKVEARSGRGHCYDFNLNEVAGGIAVNATTKNDDDDDDGIEDNSNAPTCYRGDQSMAALSSAVVMKMLMLVPALLKVIAAKAIFGIVMGISSVILSKMAILPLLLSYANKMPVHGHAASASSVPATGTFRNGVNPTNAFTLTTDNYGSYYPAQEEQPGSVAAVRLTTSAAPSFESNFAGSEFGIPTAPAQDTNWSESKTAQTYSQGKPTNSAFGTGGGSSDYLRNRVDDFKYMPYREGYETLNRRTSTGVPTKLRKASYPETVINGRNVADSVILSTEGGFRPMLTTAPTTTEKMENGSEKGVISVPSRAKQYFIEGKLHKLERSMK